MRKTVKEFLAFGLVTQLKTIGWLLKKVPSKNVSIYGHVFSDPMVLHLAGEMQRNISILPCWVGSEQFKHNIKFTEPFVQACQNKVVELLS